ncbi:hypothetical protein L198_04999 [Cryptococcus wingfieldii CBS 7118]|uniref:Uncharacterized protein n=1 Tax=Cryptococcus wingfieldii CBS 7118 TaxID=1295528 RepID=A0A1E3J4G6_9TREE|nr:hypothetical protein L198_04999 [Cryptococcus wingfieldii CBS 7118]ODN94851.1 hypothetical protein L198_04999 [Cryptococcus wingfieldii CBS 7118]
MRPLLPLLASLSLAAAFDCALSPGSIPFDLHPLAGIRTASKQSDTPPTTSEAKVSLDLCNPEGLQREEGLSDEDQCPPKTKVCVKLLNHKPSSSDPDRVTAVIPFWSEDMPAEDVTTTPLGRRGDQGLKIDVNGPEYAGVRQYLNLTLICDTSSSDPNPTLISYTSGNLNLEWATPDACPKTADSPSASEPGEGGGGFLSFLATLFWLVLLGLVLYFAIGIFYNHQQYSARGWDLVPHRDFWRDVPTLFSDLFSHVASGLRGSSSGGGRGGYSSLG